MSVVLNTQNISPNVSPDPNVSRMIGDNNVQFNMLKGIGNDLLSIKTKLNIHNLPIKPMNNNPEVIKKYQEELNYRITTNERSIDERLNIIETKIDKILRLIMKNNDSTNSEQPHEITDSKNEQPHEITDSKNEQPHDSIENEQEKPIDDNIK
jgi:hypothetical protein